MEVVQKRGKKSAKVVRKAVPSKPAVVRHVPFVQRSLTTARTSPDSEVIHPHATYNDEVKFHTQHMNIVIEEGDDRGVASAGRGGSDGQQTLKIRLSRQMTKEQQERLLDLESAVKSLKSDILRHKQNEIGHRNELAEMQTNLNESLSIKLRLEGDLNELNKQLSQLVNANKCLENDLRSKEDSLATLGKTCSDQRALLIAQESKQSVENDRFVKAWKEYEVKSKKLQDMTSSLQQEVTEWKQREEETKKLAENLKLKNDQQSTMISELRFNNGELNKKLRILHDESRKEKTNYENRIKSAIGEMEKLRKAICDQQTNVEALKQQEIAKFNDREGKLKKKLADFALVIEKTHNEKEKLVKENHRLRAEAAESKAELHQLTLLRKEVVRLESENRQINESLLVVRENLKSSSDQNAKCSICSNNLESTLKEISAENKQLKQEVQRMKVSLPKRPKEEKQNSSEIEKSLKERLEWSKAEIQRQSSDNSRATALVGKLQTERSHLLRQVADLRTKSHEQSEEREATEKENERIVAELRQELLTMQKELTKQISLNETLKVTASEAYSKLEELKKRNSELRSCNSELQNKSKSVNSSLLKETTRLKSELQKSKEVNMMSRSKLADELQNYSETNRILENDKLKLTEQLAVIKAEFESHKKDYQFAIAKYKEQHDENFRLHEALRQELEKSKSDKVALEERMVLELDEAKREASTMQNKLEDMNSVNTCLKNDLMKATNAYKQKISELTKKNLELEKRMEILTKANENHAAERTELETILKEHATKSSELEVKLEESIRNESAICRELERTKATLNGDQDRFSTERSDYLNRIEILEAEVKTLREVNLIFETNTSSRSDGKSNRHISCDESSENERKTLETDDKLLSERDPELQRAKENNSKAVEEVQRAKADLDALREAFAAREREYVKEIESLRVEAETGKEVLAQAEAQIRSDEEQYKKITQQLTAELDRAREINEAKEKEFASNESDLNDKLNESKRIRDELCRDLEQTNAIYKNLLSLQERQEANEETRAAEKADVMRELETLNETTVAITQQLNAEIDQHKSTIQMLREKISNNRKVLLENDEDALALLKAKLLQLDDIHRRLTAQLDLAKERSSFVEEKRSQHDGDAQSMEYWDGVQGEWKALIVSIETVVASTSWISTELHRTTIQQRNHTTLNEAHQTLLNEIELAKRRNKELGESKEVLKRELHSSEESVNSLKVEVEDKTKQIEEQEVKIQKLKDRWDAATVELTQTQTECQMLREEITGLKHNLEEARNSIALLQDEFIQLQQENERMREHGVTAAEQDVKNGGKVLASEDVEAPTSASGSEEESAESERPPDEVQLLKKLNEKLHGKLFRLKKRYKEKKIRVVELQVDKERADAVKRTLEKEVEKLRDLPPDAKLEEKLAALQNELEALKKKQENEETCPQEDAEPGTDVESVTINLVQVTEEITTVSQSSFVDRSMAQGSEEKTQLLEENRRLRMEIDRLEKKLERSKSKRLPLLDSLKELRAENLKLEDDVRQAYVEVSRLEQQMWKLQSHKHKNDQHCGFAENCDVCNEIERSNAKLLGDNERLKAELRRLDERLAELEDTEYNYRETVRQNVIYEQQLSRISNECNVQVELARY